jgi:hypothetical protein
MQREALRDQHRLRAVFGTHLFENGRHVCFLRCFRDLQLQGDALVRLPRAQHGQHAELLRREAGHAARGRGFIWRYAAAARARDQLG